MIVASTVTTPRELELELALAPALEPCSCGELALAGAPCLNVGSCTIADRSASRGSNIAGPASASRSWNIAGAVD